MILMIQPSDNPKWWANSMHAVHSEMKSHIMSFTKSCKNISSTLEKQSLYAVYPIINSYNNR